MCPRCSLADQLSQSVSCVFNERAWDADKVNDRHGGRKIIKAREIVDSIKESVF